MGTTSGVLTGLSAVCVYRQIGTEIGILVSPFSKPRCLLPGNRGYYLGLHERTWYESKARASGTASYFVRIVPMWSKIIDADAVPLLGTANTENTTKGTTFTFDPFPDGYACDGYRVYAGTVSGVLYYQGELSGRFNTTFTLGSAPLANPVNDSGDLLLAQVIGPPAFATAMEVFETEGAVDARVFMGGGKPYSTGYAKVAKATSAPSLACGVAGTTTAATWQAVTAGSFRMLLGWVESTVDYEQEFDFDAISFATTGGDTMAHCADTIQAAIRAARHPALYCGTGATTTVATWAAITDGSFSVYVDGVVKNVVGVNFTGDASMADVAASIQTAMQALGGSMAAATCSWNTGASIFVVKANAGSATAASLLSYLDVHTSGTGTDISAMMKGRETDTAVKLQRRGKGDTTEQSVAYSTDHFVISTSSTGQQYRFSHLSAAATGTAIGGAGFMNGASTATAAVYTPGLTAKRSVQGDGTAWGDWMEGMKFRFQAEAAEHLIGRVYGSDLISLETDYAGGIYATWTAYMASPFSDQVYPSALHNPFKFSPEDIVPVPTADGDEINAIKRNGSTVAVMQSHHIWLFDGVSITAPKMISNVWGAPNTDCCVEFGNGVAFFTGQTFMFIMGSEIRELDPEGRVQQYMERLSSRFTAYHGVFDDSENKRLIKWFIGLDDSRKANVALVYEPATGNWWMHNVKDATCSCIIRNSVNEKYLVTGDSYDAGHAIKAWMHLWSKDYKADGANSNSAYDKSGIINSAGTATATAGFLTCAIAGATLAQFQAVTAGYFSVTIDDVAYDVGPVDLSTAVSLGTTAPSVASLLQVAIRAATGGAEVVTYSVDHFIITSGTTTARSNVSCLRPYRPVSAMTDLSSKTYLNGRTGAGTETEGVNQRVLNLFNWSSVAASVYATGDGEEGVWVYVCDSNFQNGQYARIVSNTAAAITVTPDFTTAPAAGWYWYLGGIVPQFTKWLDWGSPQHKHKVHGIAITAKQTESATGNTLAIHGMQDLSSTIRTTKKIPLGVGNDSTQTVYPGDQACNQTGIKLSRPSSTHDLKIDDITISHRPRV